MCIIYMSICNVKGVGILYYDYIIKPYSVGLFSFVSIDAFYFCNAFVYPSSRQSARGADIFKIIIKRIHLLCARAYVMCSSITYSMFQKDKKNIFYFSFTHF